MNYKNVAFSYRDFGLGEYTWQCLSPEVVANLLTSYLLPFLGIVMEACVSSVAANTLQAEQQRIAQVQSVLDQTTEAYQHYLGQLGSAAAQFPDASSFSGLLQSYANQAHANVSAWLGVQRNQTSTGFAKVYSATQKNASTAYQVPGGCTKGQTAYLQAYGQPGPQFGPLGFNPQAAPLPHVTIDIPNLSANASIARVRSLLGELSDTTTYLGQYSAQITSAIDLIVAQNFKSSSLVFFGSKLILDGVFIPFLTMGLKHYNFSPEQTQKWVNWALRMTSVVARALSFMAPMMGTLPAEAPPTPPPQTDKLAPLHSELRSNAAEATKTVKDDGVQASDRLTEEAYQGSAASIKEQANQLCASATGQVRQWVGDGASASQQRLAEALAPSGPEDALVGPGCNGTTSIIPRPMELIYGDNRYKSHLSFSDFVETTNGIPWGFDAAETFFPPGSRLELNTTFYRDPYLCPKSSSITIGPKTITLGLPSMHLVVTPASSNSLLVDFSGSTPPPTLPQQYIVTLPEQYIGFSKQLYIYGNDQCQTQIWATQQLPAQPAPWAVSIANAPVWDFYNRTVANFQAQLGQKQCPTPGQVPPYTPPHVAFNASAVPEPPHSGVDPSQLSFEQVSVSGNGDVTSVVLESLATVATGIGMSYLVPFLGTVIAPALSAAAMFEQVGFILTGKEFPGPGLLVRKAASALVARAVGTDARRVGPEGHLEEVVVETPLSQTAWMADPIPAEQPEMHASAVVIEVDPDRHPQAPVLIDKLQAALSATRPPLRSQLNALWTSVRQDPLLRKDEDLVFWLSLIDLRTQMNYKPTLAQLLGDIFGPSQESLQHLRTHLFRNFEKIMTALFPDSEFQERVTSALILKANAQDFACVLTHWSQTDVNRFYAARKADIDAWFCENNTIPMTYTNAFSVWIGLNQKTIETSLNEGYPFLANNRNVRPDLHAHPITHPEQLSADVLALLVHRELASPAVKVWHALRCPEALGNDLTRQLVSRFVVEPGVESAVFACFANPKMRPYRDKLGELSERFNISSKWGTWALERPGPGGVARLRLYDYPDIEVIELPPFFFSDRYRACDAFGVNTDSGFPLKGALYDLLFSEDGGQDAMTHEDGIKLSTLKEGVAGLAIQYPAEALTPNGERETTRKLEHQFVVTSRESAQALITAGTRHTLTRDQAGYLSLSYDAPSQTLRLSSIVSSADFQDLIAESAV